MHLLEIQKKLFMKYINTYKYQKNLKYQVISYILIDKTQLFLIPKSINEITTINSTIYFEINFSYNYELTKISYTVMPHHLSIR